MSLNYRIIINILGWVLSLQGILMQPAALVGFFYGEYHNALIYCLFGAACFVLGFLFRKVKTKSSTFYAKEGFVAVALSWIIMGLTGAAPLTISGEIPSYVDALFEIISGYTTTGSSILKDVEALSYCNLFFRSFSHWIGGMGVLVFILAILPMAGGSNMNLLKAESPGPSVGKLVPRMQQTAFILYAIYFVMTIVQVILLLFGGMSLFEALCHAFASAGTGGFGIKNDSMGSYSPYLQTVCTVFMFLFGVNFSFYYLFLIRRVRDALHMEEVRWYFGIYAGVVILIIANLMANGYEFGYSLLHTTFQVSSVMTTTGFSTVDFNLWPEFSKILLVCVMFVGACAGSTGGGMKVSRIVLYLKQIRKELMQQVHPRRVHVIKMDDKEVPHTVMHSTNVFLMVYFIIYAGSVLLISLDGFDGITNFTAVAATINNIGPRLSAVGPMGNFADFSCLSKFVLMFDMLAGRLEIFPMLLLFYPTTWKK